MNSGINKQLIWTETEERIDEMKKDYGGRKEIEPQVPRQNNNGAQQQQMLQPQVWLRRQEIQQQVLAGPALIKG